MTIDTAAEGFARRTGPGYPIPDDPNADDIPAFWAKHRNAPGVDPEIFDRATAHIPRSRRAFRAAVAAWKPTPEELAELDQLDAEFDGPSWEALREAEQEMEQEASEGARRRSAKREQPA